MEGEVSSTGAVVVVDRTNLSVREGSRSSSSSSASLSTSSSDKSVMTKGGKTFKEILESKSSSYIIQRLQPHTPYTIRVFAQNPLGISADCSPLKVMTEREAPASPPRFVFLCRFFSSIILFILSLDSVEEEEEEEEGRDE